MENSSTTTITVSVAINAGIEKVWEYFNSPEHIIQWNSASPEWHTPRATNDLRVGGKINSRMEAKDGSMGFDFEGIYSNIIPHQLIEYVIGDGRKVKVVFSADNDITTLTETFEAEGTHPKEMQEQGWQAILNNFKRHVETN